VTPIHSDHLPGPTVWPATFGFGLLLLAGGLATSWLVSLGGAVICLTALRGWVLDLLGNDEKADHPTPFEARDRRG
jgi:hypothetical protein